MWGCCKAGRKKKTLHGFSVDTCANAYRPTSSLTQNPSPTPVEKVSTADPRKRFTVVGWPSQYAGHPFLFIIRAKTKSDSHCRLQPSLVMSAAVAAPLSEVVPGDLLGLAADLKAGPGTYERGGKVYASLVGEARAADGTAEVVPWAGASARSGVVPKLHSVVTCRVAKINPRMAHLDVLCVGEQAVKTKFHGLPVRPYIVSLRQW